jgi:putative addiction module CopG family antidote
MAAQTMNVSLTPELKDAISRRVRSGLYGNASDVIRAGLRALAREEVRDSLEEFERIMAELPQDPITPEIEQHIEDSIRAARKAERSKAARKEKAKA